MNYVFWPEPERDDKKIAAMKLQLQPHYDEAGLGPVPEPQGVASDVTPEHLEMLLRHEPEVISFHFGLPKPETVKAIKDAGIFVVCTATTVEEARILERSGVDAVVAQGAEAGGHRGTFTGVDMSMQASLLSLLPQVEDAVSVPVIAAGGIADGRTAAAAFMLGASAVQMGTAFLRCDETNIQDHHRAALAEADESSTIVTDLISGRPSRYIRNKLVDELIVSGLEPLPIPTQFSVVLPLGQSGNPEITALFAGQSAALTKDRPAADLVSSLAEETTRRLRAFA